MLSLRAFSRSLPRLASRSANYSTRSAIRPSIRSSLRTATSSRQPLTSRLAAFSTSSIRQDTASQELSAKLSNEISLEAENAERKTDSDSNVEAFLANNNWEVIDTPGVQDVVLKRNYDDETIMVSFSIADFNTPGVYDTEGDEAYGDEEMDDPGEMSAQSGGGNTKGAINQGRNAQGNFKVAPEDSVAPADRDELANEDDEYDTQQAFPANVDVLISRPNSKGSLRFNLVAEEGRLTVHKVMHLPPSPSSSSSPTNDELLTQLREVPEQLYTGPPFDQLDEEVQTLLEQYLDVRGLDTGLASFVPDYIDVKEQKEYVAWLGRVRGFMEE